MVGSIFGAVGTSSSPGIRRGSPYTSSAADDCKSSLYTVRMPRRTIGNASVHDVHSWLMIAVLRVRWSRSTRPLAAG